MVVARSSCTCFFILTAPQKKNYTSSGKVNSKLIDAKMSDVKGNKSVSYHGTAQSLHKEGSGMVAHTYNPTTALSWFS